MMKYNSVEYNIINIHLFFWISYMGNTPFIIAAVIVIIISIVALYYVYNQSENLVHYFDHIAMQANDPTMIHYMGRNKDILGKSRRGYYLENMLMYNNGVQPLMADNPDAQFSNVSNYMGMNPTYRPKFTYEKNEDTGENNFVMHRPEDFIQNPSV